MAPQIAGWGFGSVVWGWYHFGTAVLTWLANWLRREVMRMARLRFYEVSRAEIVDVAREAVRRARERTEISTVLVRRLMRVARTAPEFAQGDWFIDERCGCLIGNLHGRPVDDDALGQDEYEVGMEFDDALDRLTGHRSLSYSTRDFRAIVKVID